MMKSVLLVFILFLSIGVEAQEPDSSKTVFSVSFNSYASTGKDLPFWLRSNQNGAFTSENGYYQLLRAGFAHGEVSDSTKNWDFSYGTTMIAGIGTKAGLQMNQYWFGARYKWLKVKLGARNDSVRFAGLSHTNGNMIWSGNARPLPGLSFSTNGYIPLFSQNKWFTFKALYEENFLIDDRDMINAMLHHKYLYGKATLKDWSFTIGLDHWVYWGGTSRYHGKNTGIESYPRYVLGLSGGKNSSSGDKKNVAGNTIGMYVLEVEKNLGGNVLTFYWNHPFEDRSGLEMANMPDGLWGVHYRNKNRKAFVSDIVYEFLATMNQSGPNHLIPSDVAGVMTGRGRDNYFALAPNYSDNFYSSGHVFYNKMMGTPLFMPVIGADGLSKGFDNTRIEMHHLGMGGNIVDGLTWKSLLTWSRSNGTYEKDYPVPLNQFSCLAECRYRLSQLPLSLNLGVAGDIGDRFEKQVGGYMGISWSFN
jgi:hypothetical protein